MNRVLYLFACVALFVASACEKKIDDTKQPEEKPEVLGVVLEDLSVDEITANGASASCNVRYADNLAYVLLPAADAEELTALEVVEQGTKLTLSTESREELTEVVFALEGLEPNTDYTLVVAASNAVSAELLVGEFKTLTAEEPEKPEEPENPEDPEDPENPEPVAVELSALELLDVQSTTAEFSVTVKNMNELYYFIAPTAEAAELTLEQMQEQGSLVMLLDVNTSWEAEQVVPFSVEALTPATDYTIQVMGINEQTHASLSTTFRTANAELVVENIKFNATSASIVYDNPDDKRNGYLTFRADGYELTVHLQSDELAGYYTPTSTTHTYVADGSVFKKLNEGGEAVVYNRLDEEFGSIDLYENIVAGNWVVYASLFFFDNISIELDYIGVIEGAEREEAKRYVLNPVEVIVSPDGTTWNVELWQDKNNTLSLVLDLGYASDYIPTGRYATDATDAPRLVGESSSMIVDNVRSSVASADVAVSSFVVDYNATTGESYLSVELYTSMGTAVAVIENSGPHKLYEVKDVAAEQIDEVDPLIWVTHDGGDRWIVEWSGNNSTYGSLVFVTGDASLDYIPAGRYYLRSSAPAAGGWVDCKDGDTTLTISRKNYSPLADNEACYIDITTRMSEGVDSNTIKGSVRTADGAYQINVDYTGAFDYFAE